jgi:hypothetical protein
MPWLSEEQENALANIVSDNLTNEEKAIISDIWKVHVDNLESVYGDVNSTKKQKDAARRRIFQVNFAINHAAGFDNTDDTTDPLDPVSKCIREYCNCLKGCSDGDTACKDACKAARNACLP